MICYVVPPPTTGPASDLPAVEDLAIDLFVTPVIGGIRAMRWTSPLSGSCFTLYEDGAYTVTRRSGGSRATARTGRLETRLTDQFLGAPISLPARTAAAGLILEVDATPLAPSEEGPAGSASGLSAAS